MRQVEETDSELVSRSLAGDMGAFGELYARHARAVGTRVHRTLPSTGTEPGDVVHDAFVRAWCRLPQLRDPSRFRGWVEAIAVAIGRNTLRAVGREVLVCDPPDLPDAFDGLDDTLAVRQAVASLPERQRMAVTLCDLEGTPPGEAARRLGVPVATVRGRLQRGRAALRERLAPGGMWARPAAARERRTFEEVLQTVRRRNVEERHHPHGRPLVLFAGIPLDIDVVPSGDDLVHLRGSLWAMDERALSSVSVCGDAVDDVFAVGPRRGMFFNGTNIDSDGRLVAFEGCTEQWWAWVCGRLASTCEDGNAAARQLRELLRGPALRLCVIASRIRGAWLDEAGPLQLAHLSSLFRTNYSGRRGWHGPEAQGALTLELPAGSTLAVAAADWMSRISLRDTTAHVACLNLYGATAVRHAGDLTLWQTPLEGVDGLRGTLRQHLTACDGNNGEAGYLGHRVPEVRIAGLDGAADLDVGRVQLHLDDPRGTLKVNNRFGDTLLRLGAGSAATGEVRSLSGRVTAQFPEEAPAPRLQVTTVFGEARWTGDLATDWGLRAAASMLRLDLSPIDPQRQAPQWLFHNEAGTVALERVPSGTSQPVEGAGAPHGSATPCSDGAGGAAAETECGEGA